MINRHVLLIACLYLSLFSASPDALTADVLNDIYGEEDWSATIRKGGENGGKATADEKDSIDREAIAG